MAAKALEFLESAIQREKQHYIGVIDRPSSNTIEVKWTDLMRDCDDDILEWFSIFLIGKNRIFQLEQSSDITFYANSVKRKLIIKLSSRLASVTTCGSHVSMDNLLGIDFGFWPLKPILATGTPINNFALRKNVKKRDLKPFSDLKKRQKRHRLAEYRQPINEVMSQNNLSDVDQADMLLHYSNEKKNRSTCITPPVNTKMIEDLLVTFRSAIINKNQKKAISILSTIRSSESYTLETINESYCTDELLRNNICETHHSQHCCDCDRIVLLIEKLEIAAQGVHENRLLIINESIIYRCIYPSCRRAKCFP